MFVKDLWANPSTKLSLLSWFIKPSKEVQAHFSHYINDISAGESLRNPRELSTQQKTQVLMSISDIQLTKIELFVYDF